LFDPSVPSRSFRVAVRHTDLSCTEYVEQPRLGRCIQGDTSAPYRVSRLPWKAVFPESVTNFSFAMTRLTLQLQMEAGCEASFTFCRARRRDPKKALYASSILAKPRGDRGFFLEVMFPGPVESSIN
jgi:hypothetical protein